VLHLLRKNHHASEKLMGCKPMRVMLIATVLVLSSALSCAGVCRFGKERRTAKAGPEITGDYSRCYLYSPDTGCWYADPMYYVALDALSDWHARHRQSSIPAPKHAGKVSRPTIEK